MANFIWRYIGGARYLYQEYLTIIVLVTIEALRYMVGAPEFLKASISSRFQAAEVALRSGIFATFKVTKYPDLPTPLN